MKDQFSLLLSPLLLFHLVVFLVASSKAIAQEDDYYGTDVSFPMHYSSIREENKEVFGIANSRQAFYEAHLQGCFDWQDAKDICQQVEEERLAMNLRQPQSVVNFTRDGFLKVQAPEELWRPVVDFWQKNKHQLVPELEFNLPRGTVFVNHWKSPVKFLAIESKTLVGGGDLLREAVGTAAQKLLEEWTGQRLVPRSLYGIRVYTRGAVLVPHVDRMPLVISAILNVDQRAEEPWPLEVIGHHGRAINVTIQPGEMILYESHSIIHSRPFPLQGDLMANLFIHFEPIAPLSEPHPVYEADLPPYLIPNSPEEPVWRKNNPSGWRIEQEPASTKVHDLVKAKAIPRLMEYLDHYPGQVNEVDQNGWTPLHEATRALRGDMVRLLVERGADLHAKTNQGHTPLALAHVGSFQDPKYKSHPQDHPVVRYLESQIQARVNAPDELGWTPLHEAARALRGDLVKLLVEQRGANLHVQTHDGHSPLSLAYLFVKDDPKYGSRPGDHPVIRYLENKLRAEQEL